MAEWGVLYGARGPAAALAVMLLTSGCATGGGVSRVDQTDPAARSDLLYVTDREPVAALDGGLSYGTGRSRRLSFGSVSLASATPGGKTAARVTEVGRFPATPYAVETTRGGLRRDLTTVAAHQRAAAALQREVAQRLAVARRKEIVVFIHGYNNTFEDAAKATDGVCRTLRDEFVCVALTWPAGGSGGISFGYNVDRESGEFAAADFKKAIRTVAETPGVERVHLIAHSRGTDVLTTALQQLGLEAYATRTSLAGRYKIANVVLFAPDIDVDVASTKMFGVASDPGAPYGAKANPSGVFPAQGDLHLTVYSSPNDKALNLATLLFGSIARLGQLSVGALRADTRDGSVADLPQIKGLVDFIEFTGTADFFGHSYFLTNAAVGADLDALIRGRLKAGDPGRPLVEVKKPFWRLTDARLASQ